MNISGHALNMAIYFSALLFFAGILFRIAGWLSVPTPLKIPTTPAPLTPAGTVARMLGELFFFRSLWKADKLLWAAGYIFHLSLLLVVLRHLRYFLYPVPESIFWFSDIGIYAGFTLAASLLKFFFRPNLIEIKDLMLHAAALDPIAMSAGMSIFFLVHLSMVLLLAALFPFGKLMHAGGVLISPTRAMVNNARRSRHINPWAEKEWDTMLSESDKETGAYMPWSPEQWRVRWKR